MVTGVVLFSPRFFLPSIFIAHRVHSAIPLLVDFSSSVANSRARAFRKSILCTRKSPNEFLRVSTLRQLMAQSILPVTYRVARASGSRPVVKLGVYHNIIVTSPLPLTVTLGRRCRIRHFFSSVFPSEIPQGLRRCVAEIAATVAAISLLIVATRRVYLVSCFETLPRFLPLLTCQPSLTTH